MKKKKIDPIDNEIIYNLIKSPQITYGSIGLEIESLIGKKMSHTAISKRFQKLSENKLIKNHINLNINALEYQSAYIMIETKDYETQRRLIEKIRLCPRVINVDLLSGKYNLILKICSNQQSEVDCFISSVIKTDDKIRSYKIYNSTLSVKPQYFPIPIVPNLKKFDKRAPCGSNCLFCGMYKDKTCSGCPASEFSTKTYEDFF